MPKKSHENGNRSRKPFLATIAAAASITIACSGGGNKNAGQNSITTTPVSTTAPSDIEHIRLQFKAHHKPPAGSTYKNSRVENQADPTVFSELFIFSDGYAELDSTKVNTNTNPLTSQELGYIVLHCESNKALTINVYSYLPATRNYKLVTRTFDDSRTQQACADRMISASEATSLLDTFNPNHQAQ